MSKAQDLARQIHHIREVIAAFLQDRLEAKLSKLPTDDPKREDLIAQYQPVTWLEDAARRVRQIQAVTHALKAVHPDARGTNLFVEPSGMKPHAVVGSHLLGAGFASDVVGNAAALDVYKFLKLEVDGRTLLDWLSEDDPAAVRALSDDEAKACEWQSAFIGLTQAREETVASHALAKQVYWLTGEDAGDDAQYHLLSPLYATSLAQSVHTALQEDLGDANKAAREARQKGKEHESVIRHYPALAVRKLGGAQKQNVSYLNTKRDGMNYLLGSLPPQWDPNVPRQLWGVTSVFGPVLMRYGNVGANVRALLRFLQKDPPSNMETRDRVDAYVGNLIDELVAMASEIRRGQPKGWTADPRCMLVYEERLWLDHWRAEADDKFRSDWLYMDWPARIGHRFGNWLNERLEVNFKYVGEVEQRYWKKELLLDEGEAGWARALHDLRTDLDAPHYIPTREGTV
ncbi:type I-F CRISPR-associated protein Csy1 [Castellaniella defragrans]|uniref:CRISPR-associated protein Csy1 n=1 Tax=Castellaniella defragrans TaxID=75697 RepID=A0A7W9WPI0_CASDE|nr:type I-F CRISPR-associated protein Csy1 [Castellaniella defragrans]KAB0623850.1 type I-F CRISPR-associated protein Csy1 [Castellaniella defragrans]MBB6084861.1 CRISPR-associated protein Csy1 [Castellaniella defragrans]